MADPPETPRDVPLDVLVADCAERLDTEGAAALHALCAAHPRHADALREAMAPLLSFGLVGPAAPSAASTGRLGGFDLLREIGRGGMGVVYEARQPALARTVALKVLPTAWVFDARQMTRFQNEARAAATLDHPHIVRVHAVGCEAGSHFYAMQLIDGVSLGRLLQELRGTAPSDPSARAVLAGLSSYPALPGTELPSTGSGAAWARRTADLARQAARALAKAHDVGILHRDIKPGNLLVDRSGHLWVTDFGLAHFARDPTDLTRSGEFVGTLAYSSPEQVGGRVTVDARSDVYSLGATLYEILTLRPPFAADDHAALLRRIVAEEPRRVRDLDPRTPRDLEAIVHKAMAKEPTRRYQTAVALADDLAAFLEGRPIKARPVTAVQRGLRWCQRNPGLAGALLAVLLLALVASAIGYAALRAVAAESEIARLSSQHKIDARREAAGALRRALASGRRTESLRLLREATAEIATATAASPARERATLQARLRSDVLASLSLWDATAEPIPQAGGAIPLGFDRDHSLCAAQLDGDLVVRDVSGRALARLPGLGPDPWAGFSPDAEWIAIRSRDGVRLWHWRSGRVLVAPRPAELPACCFDREGRRFVACLERNHLVVCELADGAWRDLLGPTAQQVASGLGAPWYIELGPDGRSLAACHLEAAQLWIYDLAEDRPPRAIALPDHPFACLWHPDGRHVVVGGRFQDLLVVDTDAGAVVGAWPGHHAEVVDLAWSRDGGLLASCGWDGQVRIWDRRGSALVGVMIQTPVSDLDFAQGDRTLGWGTVDGDPRRPIRWRLERPAVLRELDAAGWPHSSLPWAAFHPKVPLLAVSTATAVLFFDAERGERLGELPGPPARRLRFLADGRLLVAARGGSGCRVLPVTIRGSDVRIGPPRALPSSIGLREADAHGSTACIWDGDRIEVGPLDGTVLAGIAASSPHGVHLRVAPDGRFAALGTFGGSSVAVWDLVEGEKVFELATSRRSATVAFAPDAARMVVCGCDEHRVFETGSWRQVAAVPRRPDAVSGFAAFSPDGRLLALPVTRSRLQVCETDSFAPLFELDLPDGGDLCEPAFDGDGSRLALASAHRRVFVWDLREAREQLRALGLDWWETPIPPRTARREPLRVTVRGS